MKRRLLSLVAVALGLGIVRTAAAEISCGELLIVFDRSGSMNMCSIGGVRKEDIAKAAINKVVDAFATMPMGLFVFPYTLSDDGTQPGGSGLCDVGRVVIDVVAGGAADVKAWLGVMAPSAGGTPTGESMEVVRDYDNWPMDNRAKYVLIITDGQPTCQDDNEKLCNGGGSIYKECKNPTRVFSAISALYDKGIHTFVVGFEGTLDSSASCPIAAGFNPATLDQMATLGGEPSTEGTYKYYSATDEKTLSDALTKILGTVSRGTVESCARVAATPDGGQGGAGGGQGNAGGGQGGGGGRAGGAGGHTTSPPGRTAPGCSCRFSSAETGVAGASSFAVVAVAWRARRRSGARRRR